MITSVVDQTLDNGSEELTFKHLKNGAIFAVCQTGEVEVADLSAETCYIKTPSRDTGENAVKFDRGFLVKMGHDTQVCELISELCVKEIRSRR